MQKIRKKKLYAKTKKKKKKKRTVDRLTDRKMDMIL